MTRESGTQASRGGWAVRSASNDEEERVLAAYLAQRDVPLVVEFAPKDDDTLNAELCAGRYERVVFAGLDALLTTVWKEHAQVDRWMAAGVRIELAAPPNDDHSDWQSYVTSMCDSLARWRRQQRRRQVITAVVLSALALIAMAVLFFVVPPGK